MLRLNFNYPTIHFSSDRCSEKRAKEKKAYAPNGDVMQEKKKLDLRGYDRHLLRRKHYHISRENPEPLLFPYIGVP